jgi:hypothetical protein
MTYVSELRQTEDDSTAFDAVVARLRADRAVRQSDMRGIAIAYLGWEMAKSTPRSKALQHIIDAQMVAARTQARAEGIDRLRSW